MCLADLFDGADSYIDKIQGQYDSSAAASALSQRMMTVGVWLDQGALHLQKTPELHKWFCSCNNSEK